METVPRFSVTNFRIFKFHYFSDFLIINNFEVTGRHNNRYATQVYVWGQGKLGGLIIET